MKKTAIWLIIILSIFSICLVGAPVYAENSTILNTETAGQLVEIKEKENQELADYVEIYGSESYGFVAYVLGKGFRG